MVFSICTAGSVCSLVNCNITCFHRISGANIRVSCWNNPLYKWSTCKRSIFLRSHRCAILNSSPFSTGFISRVEPSFRPSTCSKAFSMFEIASSSATWPFSLLSFYVILLIQNVYAYILLKEFSHFLILSLR